MWPRSIIGMYSLRGALHQIELGEDTTSGASPVTPFMALRNMFVKN